jgi:hypothetical protein
MSAATAVVPGVPSATKVSLSGIAKRKPKLRLSIVAGKSAPPLKKLVLSISTGIGFSASRKSPGKGISIKDARGKRLRFTVLLTQGRLSISLRTAASSVRVAIEVPAITVTERLAKSARRKRQTVQLHVVATDLGGVATILRLMLRAS